MAEEKNTRQYLTIHDNPPVQSKTGIFYDDKGNKVEKEYFEGPNGTYYTYNDNYETVPLLMFSNMSPEELKKWRQTAPNSPYSKSVSEAQNRQAIMRAAGYDTPQDGLWDDNQQNIWDKLTTKQKEYDNTLTGFAQAMMDRYTGNDTYRDNPLYQGEVKPYDPNNVDWDKTRRSQSPVIKAISGTWGPIVMAATAPAAVKTAFSAPLAALATIGGGTAGGYAVNKASEALTGRDFGTNVSMHSPLTPGMGEMLNPGYYYGAPRGAAVGDFLHTTLTGKSNKFIKPLTREYLGKPYYDNIRPSGYGNAEKEALPRNAQIRNLVIDFLKPRMLRNNVSDSNHRPKWFVDKNNPMSYEVFRNDAHRLSMGLEAHKELLPDGKLHSLYVKQPNGTYDVDWDYIRYVKQNYPDSNNFIRHNIPTDFPHAVVYQGNPSSGQVVANDLITLNGGYANYKFNPQKLHATKNPTPGWPSYFSTGDVTFFDTWDVQPFKDGRTFSPWLTKTMTSIENRDIPRLSEAAHNIKNVELVDAFGGVPFTQETTIPDQTILWYPDGQTLEQQFSNTRASKRYETLK